MKPSLRPATMADISTLLELLQQYCAFDHLPFDAETRQRTLQQFITTERLGKLWIIRVAEESVGYLALTLGFSFEYGGYDAFIDEVYIRESHRGLGLGKQALSFAEEACRALGVRALHLEVERENTNAHALYHKVGFIKHERYLMTKLLAPNR